VLVRERGLFAVCGVEGPKNKDAELPLASQVIGARGALSDVRGCTKGRGPLLPVRRLRGIGEPQFEGEDELGIIDIRFRFTEGKDTGGECNERRG
jgi:hypothetical protein